MLAVVELGGGFDQSDLTAYFGGVGVAVPSVTSVGVDGADNVLRRPGAGGLPGREPARAGLWRYGPDRDVVGRRYRRDGVERPGARRPPAAASARRSGARAGRAPRPCRPAQPAAGCPTWPATPTPRPATGCASTAATPSSAAPARSPPCGRPWSAGSPRPSAGRWACCSPRCTRRRRRSATSPPAATGRTPRAPWLGRVSERLQLRSDDDVSDMASAGASDTGSPGTSDSSILVDR